MRLFHVFINELRKQFSRPILALTFIGVAVMPMIYSGFLIKGNWDPYGQLQQLPVAVVNLDEGAEYNGTIITIGNDFVEQLKEDMSFNWQFVTLEEADRGMAANEYYAMITVPTDFSERAVSLKSDNPQQAELIYESNGYSNFIAAQISQNATKELRSELSESMTEAYAKIMVENFYTVSEGLRDASDGAGQLSNGAKELNNGINTVYTNLSTITSGAKDLFEGEMKLQTGANSIANAATILSSGGKSLAEGIEQLSAATSSMEEGAAQLVQSTSALANGINNSTSGAKSLYTNMERLASGVDQLKQGIASAASAMDQIASGSAQLTEQLQQLLQSDATLRSNPSLQALLATSQKLTESTSKLNEAQQQLKTTSEQLATGQNQVLQGVQQLSAGLDQINQNFATFQAGQEQLHNGIQQINTKLPEIIAGGKKLANGAQQLGDGAEQLSNHLGALIDGTTKLYDGLTQLTNGMSTIAEGADKLSSGAAELSDKLMDAAEQTATIHNNDEIITIMAQPVAIQEIEERKVANYGSGIAPYFLSLAFFAGALIYSNTLPIRSTYTPHVYGFQVFISKVLSYGLMGILQALIVSTVAIYILKLPVQSIPMFYLYTTIVSLTFMFLVQMLVTWMLRPGQFIALLLLILQLVSSAGTFPYELLPSWAQVLHRWMPMTYSIIGYRDVISVGSMTDMWTQSIVLLLILFISIALIGLFYFLQDKLRKKYGETKLPLIFKPL